MDRVQPDGNHEIDTSRVGGRGQAVGGVFCAWDLLVRQAIHFTCSVRFDQIRRAVKVARRGCLRVGHRCAPFTPGPPRGVDGRPRRLAVSMKSSTQLFTYFLCLRDEGLGQSLLR